MTDETPAGRDETPEPEGLTDEELKRLWDSTRGDWHLRHFVEIANNTNSEIGITVAVGGTLITGTLISLSAYFQRFADRFASAFPPDEDVESMRESMLELGRRVAARSERYDEDRRPPPSVLHLDNARVVSATGFLPTTGGSLWRVRLDTIGAWTLGEFS